jgi:glycogen synthase
VRPDVPLLGVVGRLTSQKGFDVLVRAPGHRDRADRSIVITQIGPS